MFSLCPPFRGGTYLSGGGGVPTLRSGWWGGTYLGGGRGGTYSQVWMEGVPTFPGLGGVVPTFQVGVPT